MLENFLQTGLRALLNEHPAENVWYQLDAATAQQLKFQRRLGNECFKDMFSHRVVISPYRQFYGIKHRATSSSEDTCKQVGSKINQNL